MQKGCSYCFNTFGANPEGESGPGGPPRERSDRFCDSKIKGGFASFRQK